MRRPPVAPGRGGPRRSSASGSVALSVLGGILRPVLLAMAGFGAVCWVGCSPPAGETPRAASVRSVLVVDIDTLRADHLGAYGYERPTSPHLDAFARKSVQFEWAFSQAPNTLPSQTTILTSLFPSSHRVIHDSDRLGPEIETLAERFQSSGFVTGAFVDGGYLKPHFGLDQGFDTYFDLNGGGIAEGERRVEAWLDEHHGEKFFLFVHTYDVHSPYAPPSPYRERFTRLVPPPSLGFEPTSEALEKIRISKYTPEPLSLPPEDLAFAEALYDGEIAYVDAWFGRLMTKLELLGIADTTAVAIVSDHGEEFAEHGSVLHEKLYATVTHVPLFLRVPGAPVPDPPRRIATPVGTVDLAPTLLDLAGLAVPSQFEGTTLAALALGAGASESQPSPAISESPYFGVQRSLFDERLHLLVSVQSGRAELFSYREDRAEQRDLAKERPEEVRRMMARLRKWGLDHPKERLLGGGQVVLPKDVEESLRSLGYLQ